MTPKEAVAIQEQLRDRVDSHSRIDPARVRLVAGADASYLRGDERMYAAVTVFSYPGLEPLEVARGSAPVTFPYVPGLLTFREAPALIPLFERLESIPDVLLVDGHGLAHPRGFGIASHLGVLLGLPTVGVAKSVLTGEYEEPCEERGCRSDLTLRGERVGIALRTRDRVKPVFVSVGHMVELQSAADLVLTCCTRYRLPEPNRAAHREANAERLGR